MTSLHRPHRTVWPAPAPVKPGHLYPIT